MKTKRPRQGAASSTGPKMIRIDAQVRDYLVAAVSALSGHERR